MVPKASSWDLAIETLASFGEVDTDLLRGIVDASDGGSYSFKLARERVSLRYLEEISEKMACSSRNSTPIDVSENAENVLRRVTTSTDQELKSGLAEFVLQKKATLSKLALDKLKNLILEGRHTPAKSLRQRSLLEKEGDIHYLDHNRFRANSNDDFQIAKKQKVSAGDGNFVPLKKNLLLDIHEDRNQTLQQDPAARALNSGGASEQNTSNHEKTDSLCRGMERVDNSVKPSEYQSPATGSRAKMPQQESSNGGVEHVPCRQNIGANDAKDGGENVVIPETSSTGDGDREPEHNLNQNAEVVSAQAHRLLTSQSISKSGSLETGWTEAQSCIKCGKVGELLICSCDDCPVAVHTNCLDLSKHFFENGEFYCPYCLYRRAYAAYDEAKKKVSWARKALLTFSCRDVHDNQEKLALKVPREPDDTGMAKCPVDIHADQQHSLVENIECNDRDLTRRAERTSSTSVECDVSPNQRKMSCSERVEERSMAVVTFECNGGTSTLGKQMTSLTSEGCRVSPVGKKTCSSKRVEQHSGAAVTFICNDGTSTHGEERTFLTSEVNVSPTHNKTCNNERVENHLSVVAVVHQQQTLAAADCGDNLACREIDASLVHESHDILPVNGKVDYSETADAGQEGEKVIGHEQQVEPATVCKHNMHCQEGEETLTSEACDFSIMKDKSGHVEMVNNRPCINEVELQDEREYATDYSIGNPTCREAEASPVRQQQSPGIKQPSNQQDLSLQPSSSEEGTLINQNRRKLRSDKHGKHQRKKPQIPITLTRRRLQWTTEEEETLEQGVHKYPKSEAGVIPWKQILEFGRGIFDETRQPHDLKDKWRNILIKRGVVKRG